MLKKVKSKDNFQQQDLSLLLECMDKAINGDFSFIDSTAFHNPEMAEKYNQVLDSFFKTNNVYTMRLNESMSEVGDCSYVKKMLEQLDTQTTAISNIRDSSQHLGESIENVVGSVQIIQENSHKAMGAVAASAENMEQSIRIVDESTRQIQEINLQIAAFQEKTAKINEIIDMVKKIAQKSGLLALNASIEAARAGEAGRGFAVVANQVKDLSANTTESTEDVIKQVNEIQQGIDALAMSIENTTKQLELSNKSVHQSVDVMSTMSGHITSMSTAIDSIFDEINTQSALTQNFVASIECIADSYDTLSEDCLETGKHMFRVNRRVDIARTNMARNIANLSTLDWLSVFEMDHFTFTWRVYNNLADFEHLKIEQLNNPKGCKIGKWIGSQTNPDIVNSAAFRQVIADHEELHKHACDSWYSKEEGNQEEALRHFHLTYDAFQRFSKSLAKLREVIKASGDNKETEY